MFASFFNLFHFVFIKLINVGTDCKSAPAGDTPVSVKNRTDGEILCVQNGAGELARRGIYITRRRGFAIRALDKSFICLFLLHFTLFCFCQNYCSIQCWYGL